MRGKEMFTDMAIEELRGQMEHFCGLGDRVIDQARRRVLFGEQVATDEKIYSIFEPHTDLIKRGKVRTRRVRPQSLPRRKRGGPDHAIRGAERQSARRGPRGIFPPRVTGKPLAGLRSCMARIAASSVSRTWHRASTLASSKCASRSGAAREHRGAKRTRAARRSRMVSAFAPASRDASRCCSEAAA